MIWKRLVSSFDCIYLVGFFCFSFLLFLFFLSVFSFVCFLLLVYHLYMVLRDEKKYGHQFLYNSLLSCMDFDDERQCLHVLYSSFGDLNELVALASGYKQLGITLAFYSNGIEFLKITFTKKTTLNCIMNSRYKLMFVNACIKQFYLFEMVVINVTFTLVLVHTIG